MQARKAALYADILLSRIVDGNVSVVWNWQFFHLAKYYCIGFPLVYVGGGSSLCIP